MLTASDFVNGLSGIDKMPYKVIFFNNNLWSKIVLHIVIYFCQKIWPFLVSVAHVQAAENYTLEKRSHTLECGIPSV